MRFLDRKWVERKLDEFTQDLYYGVYLRHVSEIAPDLPPEARRFAVTHPGLLLMGAGFVSADLLNDGATLRLVVDSGPATLVIEYELATPGAVDLPVLRSSITTLSNEFDYGPHGTFIHRILLYPKGECEIVFTSLKLSIGISPPSPADEAQATPEAATQPRKRAKRPARQPAKKASKKAAGQSSSSRAGKSGTKAAPKKPRRKSTGSKGPRSKKPGSQPPGESA
jgi:hypothetical protein